MQMNRRQAVAFGAAFLAGLQASAQTYPARPITLVVPYAAGGNMDIVARTLATPLSAILNQSVVIDNRGGAGGAVGTTVVSRAPADGYTLLAAAPGQIATLPRMVKTSYAEASFRPIGLVSRTSMILVARTNDARFKSLADFLVYANSNPGAVNAGHAGPGTPTHLALHQLETSANVKFTPVSYKGSAPALVDLLGGSLDVVFDQVTSSLPHLKSGALMALPSWGLRQTPPFRTHPRSSRWESSISMQRPMSACWLLVEHPLT